MARAQRPRPGRKDVELCCFLAPPRRGFAALVAGAVDATHCCRRRRASRRCKNGYADLGPVAPFLGGIPDDDLARQRTIGRRRMRRNCWAFIRAHNKAVRYMSDPAHRQEVSQMLGGGPRSRASTDALKDPGTSLHAGQGLRGGPAGFRNMSVQPIGCANNPCWRPATSSNPRRPPPMSIFASQSRWAKP